MAQTADAQCTSRMLSCQSKPAPPRKKSLSLLQGQRNANSRSVLPHSNRSVGIGRSHSAFRSPAGRDDNFATFQSGVLDDFTLHLLLSLK